jgi:hypothetical protein
MDEEVLGKIHKSSFPDAQTSRPTTNIVLLMLYLSNCLFYQAVGISDYIVQKAEYFVNAELERFY